MKPGNRPKFGKVPIPAAETSKDEAGRFFPLARRASFLLISFQRRTHPCDIFSPQNP